MLKSRVSEADIETLRSWRLQPPDPRVHVRLEALSRRRQQGATGAILRQCGLAQARVQRSRNAEVTGGLEPLPATAPSAAGLPPMVCGRPVGGSSGAVNAWLATRQQAATGCMGERPCTG